MFKNEEKYIFVVRKTDDEYPESLKDLPDAPECLYGRGDRSLLKTQTFTIVGSRRTPMQALKIGKQIAKDLSETFTILTGTADGGDSAVIEGALSGSGKIICMLAGGFSAIPQGNLPLLAQVAEKGLLLSPHPFETSVRSFSYEYRNKLLAKMSQGTLVLGAAEKSGALITARYAESFGKKVFALPYFPGASAGAGCNALLKKGGILTEDATDVLQAFGINECKAKPSVELTDDERKVYQALKDMSEAHITELSAKAGIPTFKAMAILSKLEVKGLAVNIGGNRYSVV